MKSRSLRSTPSRRSRTVTSPPPPLPGVCASARPLAHRHACVTLSPRLPSCWQHDQACRDHSGVGGRLRQPAHPSRRGGLGDCHLRHPPLFARQEPLRTCRVRCDSSRRGPVRSSAGVEMGRNLAIAVFGIFALLPSVLSRSRLTSLLCLPPSPLPEIDNRRKDVDVTQGGVARALRGGEASGNPVSKRRHSSLAPVFYIAALWRSIARTPGAVRCFISACMFVGAFESAPALLCFERAPVRGCGFGGSVVR
mmetsp:Transcript_58151/g.161050  ORF Transcript_58151/g.161050 Transcript_58151/m.161050 type:complete len:252 (-) Transcript_58151:45-800(-)